MRVRISFDALRLCLLVAAGVTSGYLWRAAFESSSPAEQRDRRAAALDREGAGAAGRPDRAASPDDDEAPGGRQRGLSGGTIRRQAAAA
jgi:hypothetical protein